SLMRSASGLGPSSRLTRWATLSLIEAAREGIGWSIVALAGGNSGWRMVTSRAGGDRTAWLACQSLWKATLASRNRSPAVAIAKAVTRASISVGAAGTA